MRKTMLLHSLLAAIGGAVYVGIELLWRGRSHFSMFVLGGVCFVLIGLLDELPRKPPPLPVQMLLGAALVTVLELAAGLALNVWLGLGVWDYSDLPLNFMGQICAPYSVLWVGLSCLAIKLENALHKILERPRRGRKG